MASYAENKAYLQVPYLVFLKFLKKLTKTDFNNGWGPFEPKELGRIAKGYRLKQQQ